MTAEHGLKVGDTVKVTPTPGADEDIRLFPGAWVVVDVDPESVWLREPGGGPKQGVRIDFPKREP
jgi:hypothetical protein